jgi:hypothetical protein
MNGARFAWKLIEVSNAEKEKHESTYYWIKDVASRLLMDPFLTRF